MKLKQIDYFLSQKDKNLNYSLDSSRTAESVSELYTSDMTPLKEEIEKEEKTNLEYSSFNKENESFNIKIDNSDYNIPNQKNENNHYFLFKLQISIALSVIYFLLFIVNMPKTPVIIGEGKNIKCLIKNNTSENIKILLDDFNFYNELNSIDSDNVENEDVDKIKNDTNYELSGYLLELKTDKKFIIRWIIGYIYFLVRIICFLFDEGINNMFFDKNKISFIQKFSCLLFPLWIFYYDIKKNIEYTKIKTELVNNKTISYYILTTKNFSMIDYVEGIIPTLFYFLISIINSGMEQKFRGLIGSNKNKIKKML